MHRGGGGGGGHWGGAAFAAMEIAGAAEATSMAMSPANYWQSPEGYAQYPQTAGGYLPEVSLNYGQGGERHRHHPDWREQVAHRRFEQLPPGQYTGYNPAANPNYNQQLNLGYEGGYNPAYNPRAQQSWANNPYGSPSYYPSESASYPQNSYQYGNPASNLNNYPGFESNGYPPIYGNQSDYYNQQPDYYNQQPDYYANGGDSGTTYDGGYSSSPDLLNNVKIVAEVARSKGIDPTTAVACMLVESNGNNQACGDHNHSFGLFQLNQNGELGNLTPEQAFNPYTNAQVALSQFQGQSENGDPGWTAAEAQRPANKARYAQLVDQRLAQARELLAQTGMYT